MSNAVPVQAEMASTRAFSGEGGIDDQRSVAGSYATPFGGASRHRSHHRSERRGHDSTMDTPPFWLQVTDMIKLSGRDWAWPRQPRDRRDFVAGAGGT
jgi:hypothetical protein